MGSVYPGYNPGMFLELMVMADLILMNANVYTADPKTPVAEAVAVADGKIVAVGTNDEVIAAVTPPDQRGEDDPGIRIIDLSGRTVIPGFIDAHGHISGFGFALERLDLVGTQSPGEIADMVKDKAAEIGPGKYILGRGWDQNDWIETNFPSKSILDKAAPDNPVVLTRIDGHALWANSMAIEKAGVSAETKDPPGGKIYREPTGAPAGVFVDTAKALVEDATPDPTRAELREAIRRSMKRLLSSGLTNVHDAGVGTEELELYEELLVKEDFPFRVYAMLDGSSPGLLKKEFGRGIRADAFDRRLTVRAVKLYADGALGSRGAALLEPYSDDPGNTGLLVTDPTDLDRLIHQTTGAGFQACVHAIGDRGNRIVLDSMAAAAKKYPENPGRMRVEHAQVVNMDDIGRFAKQGVIASMQPTHATSDLPWAGERVGEERLRGAYAWQRLLESGARVACGSDFPVESDKPLLGFYAAVTRQDVKGYPPGAWSPDQRMTRDEALKCFTLDAAYAAFEEDRLGSITPGKMADFTVLSKDIMKIEPAEILTTEVVMTIVGGKVAHGSYPSHTGQ